MGENDSSEYSDYLSGGPKKRVVKLKEVVVLGKNNAHHEKPLEPVYPEFLYSVLWKSNSKWRGRHDKKRIGFIPRI